MAHSPAFKLIPADLNQKMEDLLSLDMAALPDYLCLMVEKAIPIP